MKRKGFTLIELLAVIVILAIIALIAVPVIMNIIDKSSKKAFENSGYGIIRAGELYYSNQLLNANGMETDKEFIFPNNYEGLEIKGSKPTSGNMIISKDGDIAMAISNGKYCVKKAFDKEEITIDEALDNCTIPGTSVVYTNGSMTSNDKCIKEGTCTNGTKVNVKVNASENYDFYVIDDKENQLTLIMDRNIGKEVAWITKEDYLAAGGTDAEYSSSKTKKGPLTVLKALEERTSGWTNIPSKTYTLIDDKPDANGSTVKYQPITRTNVKARISTYTEVTKLAIACTETDNNCPSYLFTNLGCANPEIEQRGYWLSTAVSSFEGYWTWVSSECANSGNLGIRPVITLSKS